jgi:hypothetical protein
MEKDYRGYGAPDRIRTCDHPLRRRMLYPAELRAQMNPKSQAKNWSGQRDSNSRHPAPKAGALPGCAMPRFLQTVLSNSSLTPDKPLMGVPVKEVRIIPTACHEVNALTHQFMLFLLCFFSNSLVRE